MNIICYCLRVQIKFLYLRNLNGFKIFHSLNRAQKNSFCFPITTLLKITKFGLFSHLPDCIISTHVGNASSGLISLGMVGSIVWLSGL